MKTPKQLSTKTRLLCAVASVLTLTSVPATAQTYTMLKSFGSLTNITGFSPECQLVQGPDGTFYGTTSCAGDEHFAGTVFKIKPDGSGFAVLKWFTNSVEGKWPFAGLTLSGNTLYGTTGQGGGFDAGTVFKLNTDGTGYNVLKHFFGGTPNNGSSPRAKLTLSGGVLYGTTSFDSSDCMCGSVFKLNTDGTGYTVFEQVSGPSGGVTLSGDVLYGTTSGTVFKINTDGSGYTLLKAFACECGPGTGVTLSDNSLYGTTICGGSSNLGTVFKVNTDGTGYSVLKEFTGSDGANPRADLILSAGAVYGTTDGGGSHGVGTAFKVNTDGTGFAVLRHFTGLAGDGYFPAAGLALVDGVLYGTTERGGRSDGGTVFKLSTNGTGFAVLKDFGVTIGDAVNPEGGLALSGRTLFGTTSAGGDSGRGTVFQVNTDGTGYTVLKHFPGFQGDGTEPSADLTLSDGALWGSTGSGGSSNSGTVFRMNTDGTGYGVLKEFSNSEGAHPGGGLTLSGSVLYGTTYSGGSSNAGTVFKMNSDGTGYRVLKDFRISDGAYPRGGLALLGSVLYGTTYSGGSSNVGTVFKVNTDGADFTVLRQFTLSSSDGAFPIAGVILSGGILYGTTGGAGGPVSGTLFKMNTDGTGFTVLRSFGGSPGDGRYPATVLAVSAGVLYGTTVTGGWSTDGTLFMINTDGTGYAVLKQFAGSDGAYPGRLTMSDGTLYGTTSRGGSLDFGTVFKLELSTPCFLSAQPLGSAIVLHWSNPAYTLQAAPAVTGTYTNIHGATSPYTSAISGPQRFFRLIGSW